MDYSVPVALVSKRVEIETLEQSIALQRQNQVSSVSQLVSESKSQNCPVPMGC